MGFHGVLYCYRMLYIIYMMVDQNSFIRERPFFANKRIFSRIFRELHVYLSRNPCWATTPLMKIHYLPNHTKLSREYDCQILELLLIREVCNLFCGLFFCGATPYGLMGWNRALQKNNFSNSEKLLSPRMLGLLPIRAKSICLWKTDYKKPRKRHIDKP